MKKLRKQLARQWQQLRDRAQKVWEGLGGQKSPDPAHRKEVTRNINWNHIATQWEQFHSEAKKQWGELTDSEIKEVNGHFDVLVEKIQERYGIEREAATKQIASWANTLNVY